MTAGIPPIHVQRLRLVSDEAVGDSRAVARENRSAALAADDVRMAFAASAARAIEGGRAAILRPEARRALLASAVRAGLRPFDAHLIIAVVQDAARRGERAEARTLAMIDRPAEAGGEWRWAAALALAIVLLGVLVAWVG
jgi:hypothetical protein